MRCVNFNDFHITAKEMQISLPLTRCTRVFLVSYCLLTSISWPEINGITRVCITRLGKSSKSPKIMDLLPMQWEGNVLSYGHGDAPLSHPAIRLVPKRAGTATSQNLEENYNDTNCVMGWCQPSSSISRFWEDLKGTKLSVGPSSQLLKTDWPSPCWGLQP